MNTFLRVMTKVHTFVYRVSNGRFGNTVGEYDILMLYHVGAKSGKNYASPLAYFEDSTEDGVAYAVVAAAAGHPTHPGWYHNLKKNPNTTIDIKGNQIKVISEEAPKEKRDRLWAEICAKFPRFIELEQKTSRVIPIILLHPQAA